MLPSRSPAPARGSVQGSASPQTVQPLTWATLPRVAQVLACLALVHLLAVLATSLHSHSHGGGVVLFPLATVFRRSAISGTAGSSEGAQTSTEQVKHGTSTVLLAFLHWAALSPKLWWRSSLSSDCAGPGYLK